MDAKTKSILLLTLLAGVPAQAADPPLDHPWVLDLTGEYLSAALPGDRTAEASAVTFGLGVAPGDRWAFRIEAPVVRVRSSEPLWTRLEPTRRVLSAVAAGKITDPAAIGEALRAARNRLGDASDKHVASVLQATDAADRRLIAASPTGTTPRALRSVKAEPELARADTTDAGE